MKLDLVHDIQSSYRKTLNCMARPGIIENIKEESEKVDIDFKFYKSTMVLMLMLLDGEVSYKIITDKEEEVINVVNQMTFAKEARTEDADFIFILSGASPEVVEGVFRDAKAGDLLNPHKSATIIVETEGLSKEQELALTGPGIESTNYVKIQTKSEWIRERAKVNVEYPIGIDIIFTDSSENIMCLPRTTQVSKQVV